jgi:hypothetical protein
MDIGRINGLNTRYDFLSHFNLMVFPCRSGEKSPAVKDWRNNCARDAFIASDAYGILGGQKYNGKTLAIVDLDTHGGSGTDNGIKWWVDAGFTTETFAVETQSKGIHLYFLASDAQISELRAFNGGDEKNAGKLKIADQVDFFWNDGRYVIGPFSSTKGGKYIINDNLELADLPDEVIAQYKKYNAPKETIRTVSMSNSATYIPDEEKSYIDAVLIDALEQMVKSKDIFRSREDWVEMIFALKASGFKVEDAVRLSDNDSNTEEECIRVWDSANRDNIKLGTIIYKYLPDFGQNKALYIEKYYAKKAAEMFVNKIYIIEEDGTSIYDVVKGTKRQKRQFIEDHMGADYKIKVPVLKGGKMTMEWALAAKLFYENPQKIYYGFTSRIDLPYGDVIEDGKLKWNSYRHELKCGTGTPDAFWKHIRYNICGDDEAVFDYFKTYLASFILLPTYRNGIILTINGKQGSGKTTVFDALRGFYNITNTIKTEDDKAILGDFNGLLKDMFFVSLEEMQWSGDKSGMWNKLKALATSSEMVINQKYKAQYKSNNFTKFMITTNEEWSAPVESGDRRYFSVHAERNVDIDIQQMLDDLHNGGYLKLKEWAQENYTAEYLMAFDWKGNIPKNEARQNNIFYSVYGLPRALVNMVFDFDEAAIDNPFFDNPFFYREDGAVGISCGNDTFKRAIKDYGLKIINVNKELSEAFGNRQVWAYNGAPKKAFWFSSVETLKQKIADTWYDGKFPMETETDATEDSYKIR